VAETAVTYGSRRSAGVRSERDCGPIEFHLRRAFTSLFYWRIYRRLHPDYPYFAPGAVRALDRWLGRHMRVFEWGSGTSTAWLARRVGELHAIEHDPYWHGRVRESLERERHSHVDLRLIEPAGGCFARYVAAIEEFPEGSLDLVCVDGRARVECVRRALARLRPGGLLLLDDSHRPRYAEAFRALARHPQRRFDFGILQTTLFQGKAA
jgi:SAM-dependent methyltransferase